MTRQTSLEEKQSGAKSLRNAFSLVAGSCILAAALVYPINHFLFPSESTLIRVEMGIIAKKHPGITADNLAVQSGRNAAREIEKNAAGSKFLLSFYLGLGGAFSLVALPAHLRARHYRKKLETLEKIDKKFPPS